MISLLDPMNSKQKDNQELKAIIFNIQRYSLHDGPGIRTLIFFKGCPLSCVWCQNPEAKSPFMEIYFDKEFSSCIDTKLLWKVDCTLLLVYFGFEVHHDFTPKFLYENYKGRFL